MKNYNYIDENGVTMSLHLSQSGDFVICLLDKQVDGPYDVMAYCLDYEDIDDIIKDLKNIKKQMLIKGL